VHDVPLTSLHISVLFSSGSLVVADCILPRLFRINLIFIGTPLVLNLGPQFIDKSHVNISFLAHSIVFLFELIHKAPQFVNFKLNLAALTVCMAIAITVEILILKVALAHRLVPTLHTSSVLLLISIAFCLNARISFLMYFNQF
jgi:hypothetical protein